MISFLSLSLGFLQPGFHIIAFLADLSETKGRSGNLVCVHSQWINFALSLEERGGDSCPLCASDLYEFCDINSCQSFSSTAFYRFKLTGALVLSLEMSSWPTLQILKLQQSYRMCVQLRFTAVSLPGLRITCCIQ